MTGAKGRCLIDWGINYRWPCNFLFKNSMWDLFFNLFSLYLLFQCLIFLCLLIHSLIDRHIIFYFFYYKQCFHKNSCILLLLVHLGLFMLVTYLIQIWAGIRSVGQNINQYTNSFHQQNLTSKKVSAHLKSA